MNDKTTHCIGLMSGTSLDGVDICYVRFDQVAGYEFEIIVSETIPYPRAWITKLRNAFHSEPASLVALDLEFGIYLAELINKFIEKNAIEIVDFIASHGHTIFHQPELSYTLQIGNGEKIAALTGRKVVCDFRTQDVLLGGQGAPLVPIGDELLFHTYDYCLNLGGFANVSVKSEERIAFDICPVNVVLNHYVNRVDLPFDDGGSMAKTGSINKTLLSNLNGLEFYKLPAPKSLGMEWVVTEIFPLIDSLDLAVPIVLRTFTEHIAIQISKVLTTNASILITGGGAFNDFLMERIEFHVDQKISLPDRQLIDFKEALIFAFLGLLKLNDKVNILSSVTGAEKNHSSGVIF